MGGALIFIKITLNHVSDRFLPHYSFPERLNFVSYHALIKLPQSLVFLEKSGLPATSIQGHFVLSMHVLNVNLNVKNLKLFGCQSRVTSNNETKTKSCDIRNIVSNRLWQTHAGFEKRAPSHNQFRIKSKLVFDYCIR